MPTATSTASVGPPRFSFDAPQKAGARVHVGRGSDAGSELP